jgi:hypothetical protein
VSDQAPDVVVGDVVRKRIGGGSKTDHDAVVLDTGAQTLLLRRRGGNAFADPALDELVGRRVRLEGTATETTFLIDAVTVLDAENPPRQQQ